MEAEAEKEEKEVVEKPGQHDFTGDHLFKKMIIFVIPILLLSAAQLVFYSLDQLIVSNFGGGQTSFAAVSCTSFIVTLLIGSFLGISVGSNVVLARYLGKKNVDGAQKTIQTSLILAVIIGLAVAALGIPLSRYILLAMSTPEAILPDATVYLQCCFGGMPFLMIFNFGAACFRAIGDGKRPLLVMVAAGLLNVGLNLLFVLGCGMKSGGLDVLGVGLATVISQFVQACLIVILLLKCKNPYCHLALKGLRLYRAETRRVLRNGLLAGLQVFVFSISNVVIQKSVNGYSDSTITNLIAISGNAASVQLENYITMILKAFGVAVIVMTAQNRGAHNKKNLAKVLWMTLLSTAVVSVVLGGLALVLYRPLLSLFLPAGSFASADEYELAMKVGHLRMLYIIPFFVLDGWMEITSGYCRGLGHPYAPTIVTFFTATVFRLVFIFALWNPVSYFHTLPWLWAAWPMSWGLAVVVYWTFMPHFIKQTFEKIDRDNAEVPPLSSAQ